MATYKEVTKGDALGTTLFYRVNNDDSTISTDYNDTLATLPDYNNQLNRPKINDVLLTGDLTLANLGIQPAGNYLTEIPSDYITEAELDALAYVDTTELATALNDYYTKENVYTKTQVDSLIIKSGGVVVTLNGVDNSTPNFYAPVAAGTQGQILSANASGIPTWIDNNYITESNLATSSKAGTVKLGNSFSLDNNNALQVDSIDTTNYYNNSGITNNFAISKGTLDNVITSKSAQIDNNIDEIVASMIINLGDTITGENQIGLYFYEGAPTTTNLPYTSWATPADHSNDLYYDQTNEKAYKFDGSAWVEQTDKNLVNAMALTNIGLDLTSSHKRTIFFVTPTVPYTKGDWWIDKNNNLNICQTSKTSEQACSEDDFLLSSKYNTVVTSSQNDTIGVMKGTITQITADYVKFTDLSTGGNTTIAGENITTGSIKSSNYVENTSGTKINLSTGQIDSKNFKLDTDGNINLGGYINTSTGIMTGMQFAASTVSQSLGWQQVTEVSQLADGAGKTGLQINYNIPSNFIIQKAYVTLQHYPIKVTDQEYTTDPDNPTTVTHIGYARNVKLYNIDLTQVSIFDKTNSTGLPTYCYLPNTEVSWTGGTWDSGGFTGKESGPDNVETGDIKDSLIKGSSQILEIHTSTASLSTVGEAYDQTGNGVVFLYVIGYMPIS